MDKEQNGRGIYSGQSAPTFWGGTQGTPG